MRLNCNDVKFKWKSYINGELPSDEERAIDEHLESCPECEQLLNETMEEQEEKSREQIVKQEDPLNEIPIKKQAQMLRKAKWKNRLMTALTVLLIFIVVSFMTGLFTASYYGFGSDEQGRGERAVQVVKTATQMSMPNVFLGSGGMDTNFYFTLDMDFSIQKQIGKDNKSIGKLDGKMLFNSLNVKREWADGQYDVKLHFLHPNLVANEQETELDFYEEVLNETWNSLDLLPEGTVSELAITFDGLYEIDDVYQLLEGYDLDIVWYAIDTGVEQEREEYRSPYFSASNGIWGFHERAVFDFPQHGNSIMERGDGQKRAEIFKTSLHFLVENSKLAKKYIWTEQSFEEVYKYVEENGVKTYGVVVTGPSKELLRLQQNESIIYATMGEVDFWNWYNTPSSGTIYN